MILVRVSGWLVAVLVASALAYGAGGVRAVAQEPPRSRPNVVLIIADDIAWSDYGFIGHPVIRTPNLDRLARQSAVFRHAYVPASLCRPSLASIITGLYPHQHRIVGNDPAIPPGIAPAQARRDPQYLQLCERLVSRIDHLPTLPRWLGQQSYVSFQSGKWWEGSYQRGGFTAGMTHGDAQRGGRHGDEGLKIGRQGLQPIFDFIDQANGRPFFIWYAPMLPHMPHNPPERFLQAYRAPDRPEALARYYAMCTWFDDTCGQLLDFLDQRRLADNTLVVYLADNGWIQRTDQSDAPPGWKQQFAPRSKQSPYEGGIRTPLFLRWPKRIPPGEHDTLVSSVDIAPTVLAACDIPAPPSLPGANLLPVCGGKPLDRHIVFGEIFAHDVADLEQPERSLVYRWCVDDDWKLIVGFDGARGRYTDVHPPGAAPPQLFDLRHDPREQNNLADQHPDVVAKLRQVIDTWAHNGP